MMGLPEPTIEQQRDIYRDAIFDAGVNSGMISKDFPLEGPHLLMVLGDLVEHYNELQFRLEGLEK